MNIQPIPAAMVIWSDDRGRAYAIASPNADPCVDTAQERLILGYGKNEKDDLVIRSIRRGGTAIKAALDGALLAGVSRDVYTAISGAASLPEQAEIHGVKFEIGGPAGGTVVDPELAAAASDVFEHAKRGVLEQVFPDGPIGLQAEVRDPFAQDRLQAQMAEPM